MIEPFVNEHLVPFDRTFEIRKAPTKPRTDGPSEKECRQRLEQAVERTAELQPILYAHDRHAVLVIFQALDAAGKDGTIRAVLEGVNPAGCRVSNFKAPSKEELDHDFLWRCSLRLPERGMIGVFNRSHYEEVLVVRVHRELRLAQNLPDGIDEKSIWRRRHRSIRDFERHLVRNGTVIMKFFLNVSREEQAKRFMSRIDEPQKNWKFSERDVREREHWDAYMEAYEDALNATSRRYAPWYAIPADDKHYMRMAVAETIAATLERMDLRYPEVSPEDRVRFAGLRRLLELEEDA
jgi:PPK2 family polyphosphate:nucleotide phosphotransferase